MSYILDALRRAESERERGSVPGLHSQTVPPATAEAPQPSRLTPWAAAGVGGALVLLGAAAWFSLRPGAESAPAPAGAAPTAASAATPPMVAMAPAPAPATSPTLTPAPAPATAPAPAAAPRAAPAPQTAAPAVAPSPARPATPPARPAEPAPAPALSMPKEPALGSSPASAAASQPGPAPAPAPAPAATPAAPRAEARVINFDQLPEDVRRAIPPLVIGGAIYSDNAASRMLIVGGQLLHEGDSPAPGVTLEQIKPRSAVLRWKQQRYEVTF